jgi:hypothetical protein
VAANQLAQAAYTFVAALAGGYIAFRLALKNLRNARAIDRRLDWSERLHDALTEYEGVLGAFLRITDGTDESEENAVARHTREEASETGSRVTALLARADLYGAPDEVEATRNLYVRVMHVQLYMWRPDFGDALRGRAVVEEFVNNLPSLKRQLVARVRRELSLAPLPAGRKADG